MDLNETKKTTYDRNQAGGKAFKPNNPKLALYKLTVNNLLEDTYYESDEESFNKVTGAFEEVAKSDPKFPLKLAHYSREEMYLRDISQLLLVLSANNSNTKPFVEKYAPKIISRADELCTVISTQLNFFDKSIPNPLKRGVAKACFNFDRYQYAKYFNTNRKIDFRDVFNLVHPNPQSELAQSKDVDYEEIFESIIKGGLSDYPGVESLNPPKTWEVTLSQMGNTAEAWREVKDNMGLFALIRNARNMREAGLDGKEIFGQVDREWIKNSKLYPFRFYQSYKALKEERLLDNYTANFLEEAVEASLESIPEYLNDSLIAVDLSGSMDTAISAKSNLSPKEIATLFGAITAKKGGEVWGFADRAKPAKLDPHLNPVLTLQQQIMSMNVGSSTNGYKVLEANQNKDFDRVIFFTDMQLWDSTGWNSDRALKSVWDKFDNTNKTSLYMIDLANYGSLQTPEGYQNVYNINGWNDKVLDFIKYAEEPNQIIKKIESY